MSRVLAAIAALSLVGVGCGDDRPGTPSHDVLTGTVIAVDARNLTDIRSFTLKTGDKQVEIYIDESRNYSASGFVPQHLRDHVVSAAQVRVEVERRGERLVAVGMEDA
jgi:hypothetical protein